MTIRCVTVILLLLLSSVCSFRQEHCRLQRPKVCLKSSYLDDLNNGSSANNGNTGPAFPSSHSTEQEADTGDSTSDGQANTRFSVFAPDPNLEASEFRAQLRENMKADLERRRSEDPNQGNQVAKNYLDSL